jgi:hypothetical protein
MESASLYAGMIIVSEALRRAFLDMLLRIRLGTVNDPQ